MRDEMERWEKEDGANFLRKIGIRKGQAVLDFGAGVGHYSIPAAISIGSNGLVYAVDKDQNDLNKLKRKAMALDLVNIKIIKTSGELRVDLESKSLDVVLLYDILHYFTKGERKLLYKEVHRLLKPEGLLSVYPKHIAKDFPMWELRNMRLTDIIEEIQVSGFFFKRKYCGTISHDNWLTQGCVLIFKKHN
jgi:ubiquinone/menaquinone biosynthesis C-methylase UbiE